MSDSKDVIRKVRAMLAKANSTTSEEEALALAAKAAEWIQRYNLDESHLAEREQSPFGEHRHFDINLSGWRYEIFGSVCSLYFCDMYVEKFVDTSGGKHVLRNRVVICGRAHNAELVIDMSRYLEKTTMRLAKEYSRDRREVLRFEKGCGVRLGARVRAMAAKAMAPTPRLDKTENNLPTLYKTELAVAADMVRQKTGGHTMGGSLKMGSSATRDGARAAESVHLGGQLGGKSSANLLR